MVGQGSKVLYDTNVLIDATKGIPAALAELAHWDDPAISCITWIELYAGAATPEEKRTFDTFMEQFGFRVIAVHEDIMRAAADIMMERRAAGGKVKSPDAIIAATAKVEGRTVITRNTKDFKDNVRVPYTLVTDPETGAVRTENVLLSASPHPSTALERKAVQRNMRMARMRRMKKK